MFQILKQTFLNTFTTTTPVTKKEFKRQPLTPDQKLESKRYQESMNLFWESLSQKYQESKPQSAYLETRNLTRSHAGKFTKKN